MPDSQTTGFARVQVLTFDFHNTLANCDRWFHLEIRELPAAVAEHMGLDTGVTRETFEDAYRNLRLAVIESGNEIDATTSVEMVFAELAIAANRGDVHAAIDDLMREAVSKMEPVPGAAEAVITLREAGIRLGVVSSAVHHETLEWILAEMEILTCFEGIVTSASSGYYKSTPAIYQAALAQLGGDAPTSVHVGDSLRWDVETAQQAGLLAVWLQTSHQEVFNTVTPDVTPALTLTSLVDSAPLLLDLLQTVRSR